MKLNEAAENICKYQNLDPAIAEVKAALEYLKRKHRLSHPEGDFDNGGRFYLSDNEKGLCCALIRSPSRAHPFSQMVHGRTIAHVADLYNVDALEVRRLAKRIEDSIKTES